MKGKNRLSPTEETRQKISIKLKGKPKPPRTLEHCQKLSDKLKGKSRSPETRRKIGDKRRGKHHSPETCRKISDKLKGKPKSSEHCQKISDKLKGKTYEEIHGKETATKLRKIRRLQALNQLKDGNFGPASMKNFPKTTEMRFKKLLEGAHIKFARQFRLGASRFDFYLPDCKTLIETDGIYWHGKGKEDWELNKIQEESRIRDYMKSEVAYVSGLKLVRIWEDEISLNTFHELELR